MRTHIPLRLLCVLCGCYCLSADGDCACPAGQNVGAKQVFVGAAFTCVSKQLLTCKGRATHVNQVTHLEHCLAHSTLACTTDVSDNNWVQHRRE
jgi:hypothetical protein